MQAITKVDNNFSTCGQIISSDVSDIAAMGFRSIICNRPDEESPDQPRFTDIENTARLQGLQVAYLPVVTGRIEPADVAAFANLLSTLPAPIIGFCRSGKRSTSLYTAAQAIKSPDVTRPSLIASGAAPDLSSVDILIVGGGAAGIGLASSLLQRQPGVENLYRRASRPALLSAGMDPGRRRRIRYQQDSAPNGRIDAERRSMDQVLRAVIRAGGPLGDPF